MAIYDIIVVGAGPAGLTAGANAAHRGLKTLILDGESKPGGQPMQLYPKKIIIDHPGFPNGISGRALSMRLYEQAVKSGAEIRMSEPATELRLKGKIKRISTPKGSYAGRRVILATGLHNIPRKLDVLEGYKGKNVHYFLKEPRMFLRKDVLVIGGGDTAFERAETLAKFAKSVTIAVRENIPKAKDDQVAIAQKAGARVMLNTQLASYDGRYAILRSHGKPVRIRVSDIIVSIGFITTLSILEKAGLEKDAQGMIKVNEKMETSVPGVFAAGDLVGEVKLIALSCSEGILAAINTFNSIKKPYWLHDRREKQ